MPKKKTIFLQDIKRMVNHHLDDIGYFTRDRLEKTIEMIIKKNHRKIDQIYKLKNMGGLCKEEKEHIEDYIEDTLKGLVQRNIELEKLGKRIFSKGKNQDIEEEMESIFKLHLPTKNE